MSRAKLRTREGWRALDRIGLFGTAALAIALVVIWPRTTIPNPVTALLDRFNNVASIADGGGANQPPADGVGQLADAGRTASGQVGDGTVGADTSGAGPAVVTETGRDAAAETGPGAADESAPSAAGGDATPTPETGPAAAAASSDAAGDQAGPGVRDAVSGEVRDAGESLLARAREALTEERTDEPAAGSDSAGAEVAPKPDERGAPAGDAASGGPEPTRTAETGAVAGAAASEAAPAPATETTSETTATPAAETQAAETPTAETQTAETQTAETQTAETQTAETPTAETPTAETSATDTASTADEERGISSKERAGSDDTQLAMASPDARGTAQGTTQSTAGSPGGAAEPPAAESAEPRVTLDCDDLNTGVDLRFASGGSGLGARDQALLRAIARCARRAGLTLEIGGHTDSEGDSVGNLLLSVQRAELVAGQLDRLGIPAERLQPRGYGESQPRADNFTATGRALNRRVTVRSVPG